MLRLGTGHVARLMCPCHPSATACCVCEAKRLFFRLERRLSPQRAGQPCRDSTHWGRRGRRKAPQPARPRNPGARPTSSATGPLWAGEQLWSPGSHPPGGNVPCVAKEEGVEWRGQPASGQGLWDRVGMDLLPCSLQASQNFPPTKELKSGRETKGSPTGR